MGNFDWFSADSDGVTDSLTDGLTDKSNDVWTEGNFLMNWTFRKFHRSTSILMSIFTRNFAVVGQMEQTMYILADGQTSRWNHFSVGRQTSHVTDIQTGWSCY